MSLGSIARRVLGRRLFAPVARVYRAFFVDLDAVADCFPETPPGREVLDVGGGDGELLNRILVRRPNLRVVMVDISPSVGIALEPRVRERVRLFPATSLAAYRDLAAEPPDLVLLSDVLHHIPVGERERFLGEIAAIVGERPVQLVIKEVAPKGIRAFLGWMADRWVSGDRNVSLLDRDELRRLVGRCFPDFVGRETALFDRDAPNYCFVFAPGEVTSPSAGA